MASTAIETASQIVWMMTAGASGSVQLSAAGCSTGRCTTANTIDGPTDMTSSEIETDETRAGPAACDWRASPGQRSSGRWMLVPGSPAAGPLSKGASLASVSARPRRSEVRSRRQLRHHRPIWNERASTLKRGARSTLRCSSPSGSLSSAVLSKPELKPDTAAFSTATTSKSSRATAGLIAPPGAIVQPQQRAGGPARCSLAAPGPSATSPAPRGRDQVPENCTPSKSSVGTR